MKKKLLFFIMACMIALCSACTYDDFESLITGEFNDDSPDNTKINIVVSGVDGGVLTGSYACEWNGAYAYYDSGVIYYFEDKDTEAKTVEHPKPVQMAMNEKYLYLTATDRIYAVDLNTMEKHLIGEDEDYTVSGINVYPDGVFAKLGGLSQGKIEIYDISKLELNCVAKDYEQFLEDTKHYVGTYGYQNDRFDFFINGKFFQTNTSYCPQNGWIVLSCERVVEYDGLIYMLFQESGNLQGQENNVKYRKKECDHLVCVDPKTETSESLYKTSGPQEQIVNFSIENNEMYLLVDGILYKTDLEGGQRVELGNYVGSSTLYFDYANNTLFVYDGDKLLGQYK